MGNVISNRRAGSDGLDLSNGGTSVVLSVLLLSGSDLAAGPWQHEFVRWLAAHDQSMRGIGTVGFDLDEIAWTPDDFAAQHAFVLAVVDGALARRRWEVLGYEPPFAPRQLAELRELVVGYRAEFVTPGRTWEDDDVTTDAGRCERHDVLRYVHWGCLLCNDGL